MLGTPRRLSRPVLASLAASILIASFLVPIADLTSSSGDRLAARGPVTPVLQSIPLTGIDAGAVAESAVE